MAKSYSASPGQALVIMDVEDWKHILEVYKTLALDADPRDQKAWNRMIHNIDTWVKRTAVQRKAYEPEPEMDDDDR